MNPRPNSATLRLVSIAYGVAITPERFEDLLSAWDDWADANLNGTEAGYEEISDVFHEAVSASKRLNNGQDGGTSTGRSAAPTLFLDGDRAVIGVNAAAQAVLDAENMVAENLFSKKTARDLRFPGPKRIIYRLAGRPGRHSYLAVETPASPIVQSEHPGAIYSLRLVLMDWSEAFAAELESQLDLSAAEIRIARGLMAGHTAQEIAGELGRSLATIRTHIKHLLQKTGVRRQTELVQFLTILRQVTDVEGGPYSAEDLSAGDISNQMLRRPTGGLNVVRYGMGQPVLYLTSSSRPQENAVVRRAFQAEGLEVIAPDRPGFGQSSVTHGDSSDVFCRDWLGDVLALTEGVAPIIAGHREGGILAIQAAAQLVRAGQPVQGVSLISTGAPVVDLRQFNSAQPSTRRSFVSAHTATAALRLGYHTAAHLFRSGRVGQDKIIQFFVKDSPVDRDRLVDPEMYETLRQNLVYCFKNPAQIVRDVARWGSDWSDDLQQVLASCPVQFLHGTEHNFHDHSRVQDLCQTHDNLTLISLQGSGQFAIYDQPAIVAKAVARLAAAAPG